MTPFGLARFPNPAVTAIGFFTHRPASTEIWIPETAGLSQPKHRRKALTGCILVAYTSDMGTFKDLAECTGFQWDRGNFLKNWEKHGVHASECEQVFFNRPLLVVPDARHSKRESRYYVLGKTDAGSLLFVIFTVRATLIRMISARDMSRKERKEYEKA